MVSFDPRSEGPSMNKPTVVTVIAAALASIAGTFKTLDDKLRIAVLVVLTVVMVAAMVLHYGA